MIEISLIYESRPVRQILKPTHNVSNPINIVSFGASLLLCYRSSLHATKVSHILVCIFVLCLSPCHGCVANTSVTLRSNMAAASASPLRCSLWQNSINMAVGSHLASRFLSRGLLSQFDNRPTQAYAAIHDVGHDLTISTPVVLCSEITTRALLRDCSMCSSETDQLIATIANETLLPRNCFFLLVVVTKRD